MGITVRSGGHSMVGHGARTVRSLDMEACGRCGSTRRPHRRRQVRASTSGEYAAAVFAHGLATPHGDAGSVGLGGLTLGGGIGYLVRKYGMSIDFLVSTELVTADGDVVHTSADQEPELFLGHPGRWRQPRVSDTIHAPASPGGPFHGRCRGPACRPARRVRGDAHRPGSAGRSHGAADADAPAPDAVLSSRAPRRARARGAHRMDRRYPERSACARAHPGYRDSASSTWSRRCPTRRSMR